MEKFNKSIEISPLYVCSINKSGEILTSCGNDKEIFKYDSDIKIKSSRLVISEYPRNDLSKKTYKKLFKYMKRILKGKNIKESVYVYIGKDKGTWYKVNIEKDNENKDNVILIWFHSTYNVNFGEKNYIVQEASELEKMIITKSIELDYSIKSEKNKTEFFADLSHDLRTPLNVILGALQLVEFQMKKEKIIDKEKILDEYLKVIRFNALRLLRLVNNIIDITKLDSGFEELDLKKCNIVSLAEEVTRSVIPYMRHKEIEVIFDTDFEEIYRKYGDKISFHGTIGTQTVMPKGTPQDVKEAVWRNLDIAGEKGGLFAAPTHMLEPEVPLENILAYVEACRTYKK